MTDPTGAPPVEASWTRIKNWLNNYAPNLSNVCQNAADPVQIERIEQEVRTRLPRDLWSWWSLCGGLSTSLGRHTGYLIPLSFNPLPLYQVTIIRRTHIEVREQHSYMFPDGSLERAEGDLAGTRFSGAWLDHWLPVAGSVGGDTLFIDLRSGPSHGCVTQYDRTYGASQPPVWHSIGLMLHDIADTLEEHKILRGAEPAATNGSLEWRLV